MLHWEEQLQLIDSDVPSKLVESMIKDCSFMYPIDIGVWAPPPPPPTHTIFWNGHFLAKKQTCNIRAKPLGFSGKSAGENIQADLPRPQQNWSHTPMPIDLPFRQLIQNKGKVFIVKGLDHMKKKLYKCTKNWMLRTMVKSLFSSVKGTKILVTGRFFH